MIGPVMTRQWLFNQKVHKPTAAYRSLFGFLHDNDAGTPYPSLDSELKALDEALREGI